MPLLELFGDLMVMPDTAKMISKRSARTYLEDGQELQAKQSSWQEESASDETESTISTSSSTTSSNSGSPIAHLEQAQVPINLGIVAEEMPGQDMGVPRGECRHGVEILTPTTAAATQGLLKELDVEAIPVIGQPVNFGVVVPGVYRSSYPRPQDYSFLKGLKLKTVV